MELDITTLFEYAVVHRLKQECPEVGAMLEVFLRHGVPVPDALEILEEMNDVLTKNHKSPGSPQTKPHPKRKIPGPPQTIIERR